MNEDKEINELATEIYTLFRSRTMSRALARRLYGKVWRKQSDNMVEVIRCKDCVYCEEKHYEELGDIPYIKLGCKWSNYSHQPDDYCSLAEAKMKGGAE